MIASKHIVTWFTNALRQGTACEPGAMVCELFCVRVVDRMSRTIRAPWEGAPAGSRASNMVAPGPKMVDGMVRPGGCVLIAW